MSPLLIVGGCLLIWLVVLIFANAVYDLIWGDEDRRQPPFRLTVAIKEIRL